MNEYRKVDSMFSGLDSHIATSESLIERPHKNHDEDVFNESLTLTTEESIISMFDHTDKESGILYIPEWPCDDNFDNRERFYKCKMNWNEVDLDDALWYYVSDYKNIKKIAKKYDSIRSSSDIESFREDQKALWDTYIRDFETGDIDVDLIMDISDRMKTIAMTNAIAEKINSGIEVSKEDMSFYNDYKDTTVSEEEKALYNSYRDAIHADAERRVGDNIAAYEVVIHAKRLFKLFVLDAPKDIIKNEANLLAQAMVIHMYCKEMEIVDDVEYV